MMRFLRLLLVALVPIYLSLMMPALAQRVWQGEVRDSATRQAINDAIISLYERGADGKAKSHGYALSDAQGRFSLKLAGEDATQYYAVISHLAYKTIRHQLRRELEKDIIYLKESQIQLKTVEVKGYRINSKGDTVTFRASAFINGRTYSLEDLIKRMPGLEVSSGGKIYYQGQEIQGLYIEGMNMLDGRYTLATRTLRAEDILSVDVIEGFQPVKALRKIRPGDKPAINVRLKNKNMVRPVGEVSIGGGHRSETDKLLYNASANSLIVNSKLQMLSAAGTNNRAISTTQDSYHSYNLGLASAVQLLSTARAVSVEEREVLDNTRTGITANMMHKLKGEETSLKYHLGYDYARTESERYRAGMLYNGHRGQDYQEQEQHRQQSRLAVLGMNYKVNGEKLFLDNTMELQADWQKGAIALSRDAHSLEQYSRIKHYALRDVLNYKYKGSKHLVEFTAHLDLRSAPLIEVAVPWGAYAFSQDARGFDANLLVSSSYSWLLSRTWQLGLGLQIEGKYGSVTTEHSSTSDEGYAHGGGLKLSAYPKLAYNGEKLRGSISLPLVFAGEGYRYIDHTLGRSPYRIQQVFPGLEFTAAYLANAGLKFLLSGGVSTDYTQPLSQLLMLPIQSRYDYIRRGTSPQSMQSQTYSGNLLVEFKRPHLGFFSNLMLNASRRFDEQTINYGINATGNTTASIVSQRSHSDILFGKYEVSKYIDAIETKAQLELRANYMYSPMQLEGRDMGLCDRGYMIRPTLSFSGISWLSLDLGASYGQSYAEVAAEKRRNHTLTIDPSVSISLGDAWSIEARHQTRWVYGDSYANKGSRLSFLDCQVDYKQKRYKLSLSATNLLGANIYEQSRNSATLLLSERRHLRPREITLSISYKY